MRNSLYYFHNFHVSLKYKFTLKINLVFLWKFSSTSKPPEHFGSSFYSSFHWQPCLLFHKLHRFIWKTFISSCAKSHSGSFVNITHWILWQPCGIVINSTILCLQIKHWGIEKLGSSHQEAQSHMSLVILGCSSFPGSSLLMNWEMVLFHSA